MIGCKVPIIYERLIHGVRGKRSDFGEEVELFKMMLWFENIFQGNEHIWRDARHDGCHSAGTGEKE